MGDNQAKRNDQGWNGVSCTSWLWVHAANPAQFEIRRAIGNLTGGMRTAALHDECPRPKDILRVVRAAHEAQAAAADALNMAVAEAASAGISWREIGKQLGIGKTGAQKRFGKVISAYQSRLLEVEATGLTFAQAGWAGNVPEEDLGYSDDDWEAAPAELIIQHCWGRTAKAGQLLSTVASTEHDSELRNLVYRASEQLREFFKVAMTRRFVNVLTKASRSMVSAHPWEDDHSAVTYALHAAYRSITAYLLLLDALQRIDGDESETEALIVDDILLAKYHCDQAVIAMSRPETIRLIIEIEKMVNRLGDSVYTVKDASEGTESIDPFTAYWRDDLDLLGRHLGIEIDESEEGLTLDFIRSIFESSD
ncbi:hypothetical protein ACFWIQ_30170 [Kitasatospora sp. NPDC127059]|uniref:hypothetical protein n=1 Tax=unclassified Kitasatospora TaxID=2633591 RepID=UPI003646F84C